MDETPRKGKGRQSAEDEKSPKKQSLDSSPDLEEKVKVPHLKKKGKRDSEGESLSNPNDEEEDSPEIENPNKLQVDKKKKKHSNPRHHKQKLKGKKHKKRSDPQNKVPMLPEEIKAKILIESLKKREMIALQEKLEQEAAAKKQEEDERAEYASNPNEFTKSGTPMPFWMMEMKKGTEYMVKLHRKYGKVEKHELRPAFKPDLQDIDIDVKASFLPTVEDLEDEDVLDIGIAHLIPVDRLFLTHKVELHHGVCLCNNTTINDYRVVNYHGHLIYRVSVEKRRCCRLAYIFKDFYGHETLKLEPRWSCCCTAKRKFDIYCPVNKLAGFIIQANKPVCADPEFFIHNKNNIRILEFYIPRTKFKVSSLSPNATADYVFEYKSVRGQGPLGRITTKLAELKRANFTDFDYYGIHLQDDMMSANVKGLVMAAWFIIYLFCYGGKTHVDAHHSLNPAAKNLFEDKKPSVEEIEIPEPDDANSTT